MRHGDREELPPHADHVARQAHQHATYCHARRTDLLEKSDENLIEAGARLDEFTSEGQLISAPNAAVVELPKI